MRLWPPNPVTISILLGSTVTAQDWEILRESMVKNQIQRRGVKSEAVLQAMRETPRHLFVPENVRKSAYEDRPLPIGYGQTISQPYIVGSMTDLLHIKATDKLLEIGTGSGYQAAILSKLAGRVYSIEVVEPLAREAGERLRTMGYQNVSVRAGDGYLGWPEEAPFDKIIVTAAPPEMPEALLRQLKNGGRLVAPIGREWQELVVVEKDMNGKTREHTEYPVMFVPMVPRRD